LLGPPVESLHYSSGDGLVNACRTLPGRVDKCVARLSSAAKSGRQVPVSFPDEDALKLANVETYEYIMLDTTPLSPLGEEIECSHYLLMKPECGDLCENSLLFTIEPRDSMLIWLERKISLHSEEVILQNEEAVLTCMNAMPCAYNDSYADYHKQCRHPKVTEVYLRALMSRGYGCHMIECYYVPTLIALKDTDKVCANLAVVAAVSPGSSYACVINSAKSI